MPQRIMSDVQPAAYSQATPNARRTCSRCAEEFDQYANETVCAPCRGTGPAPGAALSFRERQLVSLACSGMTNKEMGAALCLSEGVIKVYLSRLFLKTGTTSRHELAVHVLRGSLDQIAARLIAIAAGAESARAGEPGAPDVPALARQTLDIMQEVQRVWR